MFTLKHDGRPLTRKYVESVLDAIGPTKFYEANPHPWAKEIIERRVLRWKADILIAEGVKEVKARDNAQDKPLEYRPVRCKACGLEFLTSDPKGSVRCPSCPGSGSSGHAIEELSKYWVPPPKHEYKTGEEVPVQTPGSMSDEAYNPLHHMFRFKKKQRRWY